jgi:hypothetical protein
MFNEKILTKILGYYPKFQLKFKNESTFMKILGSLMFWNKDFVEHYTTTMGNTIYFPNREFIPSHPVSTLATLLHELTHIYDGNKLPPGIFGILYLFPQILVLLLPILAFFIGPFSLLLILFLLPIPAYFRMYFEKRAYLVSLYVLNQLNQKFQVNINLNDHKENYLLDFKNSNYYFMWPFNSLDEKFEEGLKLIKIGRHPYEDPVFAIIDDILNQY